MFLTSNFRRMRNLAMISLLEETKTIMRAISIVKGLRVSKTRKVRIRTSRLFRGTFFSSTRLLMLPKNVPKALRLGRREKLTSLLYRFGRGKEGVTTVYTTPAMLKTLKLLGRGTTYYCPKVRRRLGYGRTGFYLFIASKGVAADHNIKATVPFTLRLVHRLFNGRGTSRVTRSVMCGRWG